MIPLLYQDDDILILDKPAGLAVQPGAGVSISVLEVLLRDHGLSGWLVHRLDKDTAGCLVVARSAASARRLSGLMETHSMEKLYQLVVLGRPVPAAGWLEQNVQVHGRDLNARTQYRTLSTVALPSESLELSLLEVRLETGRMHQIRQHCAHAGWPILGDDKYGDFRRNKLLAKALGAKKLFLYAQSIRLPLQPPVQAAATLPPHFAALYQKTGLGDPAVSRGQA
ncbi:MAG: RluA family pseudouridine synthase [Spirochaetes bacterium]|nr:RluA family pseudouridine synthase [Spirochaetota bacterium]MBU0955035.1 RluA family pseudouridine synthase [Spirochaetota bacterium]